MSDRSDEDGGAPPGDGGTTAEDGGTTVDDATTPGATAPADDRAAASVGVGVAAVAIVAAALPGPAGWELVAATLGGATALAFGLRRWGVVDRTPGALLAAAASLAVGGYGLARLLLTAADGGTAGVGPWVAAGAGLAGLAVAYADWAAIPRAGLVSRIRGTLVGAALGGAGLVGIILWANVLAVLFVVATGGLGDVGSTAIGALGLGLGAGTVGLLYLRVTDRPLSYIDFRVPDRWDVAYTLGGIVALLGVLVGLSVLFTLLGTSPSEHSIVQQAEQNPGILLVLIPAAWLVIGPGEELLFRNVVQKSLYGTFSRPGAVLVASAIFAAAHFQAYFSPNPVSLLQSLLIVFVLSLLLGALYERTENTTVPALVHGTYNAVLFIALYLGQTGNEAATVVAALLVP